MKTIFRIGFFIFAGLISIIWIGLSLPESYEAGELAIWLIPPLILICVCIFIAQKKSEKILVLFASLLILFTAYFLISNAETYYRRGISYNKEGQHESAIQAYSKAVDLNPMHDRAYNNRGLVYRSKGEYDKAIHDFCKAIELMPNNVYAYNNRGLAYNDKRQYDRAIQDYNKAIELNPMHADAYYNRGIAYSEKGLYERAIQDYSKAIDLNPKYAPAFINRGLLYIQKLKDKRRGCSDWKYAYDLGIPSQYILSKKKGDCE